ncbi:MAG: peptide-methionine (S)-S-oxide reductase MsrA [Candidatus Latescibacteria bacterium]|nr:peptide-methionine (S)-S-oxide reductase MsrA [Candidatus Latescibacterota bacterium]NIO57274.1 peptide-methionine (S)-S-oxide reductase MsrA [Candidatus Latescibacterota bacterium]
MWKLSLIVILILGQTTSSQAVISRGLQMSDQPKSVEKPTRETEIATLGGGCFWCLEAVFEEVEGVNSAVSGYSGGTVKNPSYEAVCTSATGHAEVVQIRYDPGVIGYDEILDVFFSIHDPTTPNRQGADVGSQYRSVIFYHDERQKEIAERKIKELDASGIWDRRVVTELVPLRAFYEAEEYHQEYFKRNPEAGYCRAVIVPKLLKFRDLFGDKLKQ